MPKMLACDSSSFEGTLSRTLELSELNFPQVLKGSQANPRDMMSEWIKLHLIKTYF